MKLAKAYAAMDSLSPLVPFAVSRRDLRPDDVLIRILYCGVCHSDLHQVRSDWGASLYPMVPGHEIVGVVEAVGSQVDRFRKDDKVGVGCLVDSCRECSSCKDKLEQYCSSWVGTYNAVERDGKTPTFGGYSTHIVVDQNFVLRLDKSMPLDRTAPLLCAGITTYSPLKHWGTGPNSRVGVVGLGGLGHMAVRLARSFGAEVTVFTSQSSKIADAKRLGAQNVFVTRGQADWSVVASSQDLILDTVSAAHDLMPYIQSLRRDGTLVMLGLPNQPPVIHPFPLVLQRRRIAGSLIGGLAETQEMLDHCARHGVYSDVEVLPISQVNTAFERLEKADVKYRFVLDLAELHAKL